jgi:hypothetical protein
MKITPSSKVTLINNKQQTLVLSLKENNTLFNKEILLGKSEGDLFIIIEDDETVEYKVLSVEF